MKRFLILLAFCLLAGAATKAQTNTFCASNLSCTVSANWTFTGNFQSSNGFNYLADLDQVKIIDGCTGVSNPKYACSDAGIQAAQNALSSGGEIWITANSIALTISNTVNITNPYIMVRCAGLNTGITVANTGDVFNVTNNGFVFADCRVAFTQSGTRTGAVVHANSASAVSGVIYDIYASGNAGATNNGIFFLADQPSAGSWQMNQIQMPRGATWNSAFKFSNSSATTTIQGFTVQQFVGGASFTDAAMVIDGAVDTVQVTQSKFNNDSASSKTIHFRNTFGTYNVTSFAFPRWAYFDQVSCESVSTSTCLQLDTGRQFHYLNGYIAASQIGAAIGASTTDTDISHNTVASIQQSAFTVANGALNTNLSYNSINDTSQQTANTYDVFSVAANTTDVSIVGNQYRCPSSVTFHNAVTIASGTGTRLKVVNNNFPNTSCIGTGVVSSGATGTDVQIYGNGDLNSTNSRFFLGAGEISFGETTGVTNQTAGQDNCAGDSTAHAIKCSYNGGSIFQIPQEIGSGNVTTAGTAINTLTCQAQTGITVTGAATTDNVIANIGATLPATWQTGIVLSAHVTATNTVTVYLCNPTATATITPAATQVNVRVLR